MRAPTERVLPQFPYRVKFTQEQTDELAERINRIRFALTDMIGLSGYLMQIDEGSIANIASHLALAGADLDDERAYIWGKPIAAEDDSPWRPEVEWLLKSEHAPPPPESEPDAAAKAKAAADQIRRQLPDEVRAELAAILAGDYEHIRKSNEGRATRRDKAEGRKREAELRAQLREDNE